LYLPTAARCLLAASRWYFAASKCASRAILLEFLPEPRRSHLQSSSVHTTFVRRTFSGNLACFLPQKGLQPDVEEPGCQLTPAATSKPTEDVTVGSSAVATAGPGRGLARQDDEIPQNHRPKAHQRPYHLPKTTPQNSDTKKTYNLID
jgi:hypothetical protein